MKKYVRQPIYCGILGKKNDQGKYQFEIDFENNTPEDAIQFIKPYFKTSKISGANIYWFGYQFNGKLDKDYRDACITYLKNVQPEPVITEENQYDDIVISNDGICEADLYNMIERSMRNIHLDNLSVDAVVYPVSTTNNLVKYIARSVRRYLNNPSRLTLLEIQKADPKDIVIDVSGCMDDIENGIIDDHNGLITEDYLYNLQNEVQDKEHFSLKSDISPMEIRPYVRNFMELKNVDKALQSAEQVLIVDDFKTTGTTLSEMIRIIRQYNPVCQIYVFTLLGNGRKDLR